MIMVNDIKGLYELLPEEYKHTPLDDYTNDSDKTIIKLKFTDNDSVTKLISIKTPNELNMEFTYDAENMYKLNSNQYEGYSLCFDARDSFDDYEHLPNYSEIINEEFLNYYIGLTGLVTLNMDDDTVASGEIGTHNVYYAFIQPSDNVIYMFDTDPIGDIICHTVSVVLIRFENSTGFCFKNFYFS